jgi:rhodanese-related sulfurtransferase
MTLKLVYALDGKVLGAQAVGGQGVDKRIDVIATAIAFEGTVWDLAGLDLAYAPPYGSAKDPIHMAAFVACNDLREAPSVVAPDAELESYQVVDVRNPAELERLPLSGAVAIPLDQLSGRIAELDATRPTITVCHSGKRGHVAASQLKSRGFQNVANLTGGMLLRNQIAAMKSHTAERENG